MRYNQPNKKRHDAPKYSAVGVSGLEMKTRAVDYETDDPKTRKERG